MKSETVKPMPECGEPGNVPESGPFGLRGGPEAQGRARGGGDADEFPHHESDRHGPGEAARCGPLERATAEVDARVRERKQRHDHELEIGCRRCSRSSSTRRPRTSPHRGQQPVRHAGDRGVDARLVGGEPHGEPHRCEAMIEVMPSLRSATTTVSPPSAPSSHPTVIAFG